MPLFEYKCADCSTVNEVLVGVGQASADISLHCERCGGTALSKMLSRINIGRSASSFSPPCGESSCPAAGPACCGGGCSSH